jgi:hypothetical protein
VTTLLAAFLPTKSCRSHESFLQNGDLAILLSQGVRNLESLKNNSAASKRAEVFAVILANGDEGRKKIFPEMLMPNGKIVKVISWASFEVVGGGRSGTRDSAGGWLWREMLNNSNLGAKLLESNNSGCK